MRRMILMALLCSVVGVACGGSTEEKFGPELFAASCSRCHGDRGEGSIGPPIGTSDSNAAAFLSDGQIFGVIRVGPGAMPANPGLSDQQVDSLVAFLRSLQPDG
jgi:mono/diheme cytochrome c family protein